MAWLSDHGLQPRSGWSYKDKDTSVLVTSNGYQPLIREATKHRTINHLPCDNVEELVNDYLCANNPPNFCQQGARGLGDVVYSIANPLARGLDRLLGTSIHECTGCRRRRDALNQAVPL